MVDLLAIRKSKVTFYSCLHSIMADTVNKSRNVNIIVDICAYEIYLYKNEL